jgi:hypothetical protein
MENVQFIAAKDLPVAESKDVNALCVENGELKQKPMSSGAGGYVIRVNPEWLSEDSTDEDMIFNSDICYDEIAELVYNGGSVWVDMSALMGVFAFLSPVGIMRDGDNYGLVMSMAGSAQTVWINMPAGTWQPPTE